MSGGRGGTGRKEVRPGQAQSSCGQVVVFSEMSRALEKETSQVQLEDRAWAGWSSGEELSPRI